MPAAMQYVRSGPGAGNKGLLVPMYVEVPFRLDGAAPATAANWGAIFYVPLAGEYELAAVYERHTTAGSDAGAVTVMLKKVPSGTAPGSGTDMLASGLNLKATANTLQAGVLSATTADLRLANSTDGVAAVLTGTPTALAGVTIMTIWRRV